MRVPSGLNAAPDNLALPASRTIGSREPSACQTRAVPSPEAVTIRVLSGLNAAAVTQSLWPVRTTGGPVPSACQTRAVPSLETVTMRAPSGLNTAPFTLSVCPPSTSGSSAPSAHHTSADVPPNAVATMRGVGARKPPTRRATVGVLAILMAAGARSRREVESPSEVQDKISRWKLAGIRPSTGAARRRHDLAHA